MLKKSELIQIPIFNGKLQIIICDSLNEINTFFDEIEYNMLYKFDQLYAHTINGKAKENLRCIYLIFNLKHQDKVTCGVVAHEAYHAVHALWEQISEDSSPNSETEACLIQWFADNAIKFLIENGWNA